MTPGLISIIIPCYNQGIYLKETIQSALASTYRPLEILLINDGSTDNSLELAQELETQHPEVRVIDQANGGVTKARNAGIAAAQGEYILPVDGDDLIAATYIEQGLAILSSRPEVKVVYCQAEKFTETTRKPWKLKPFSLQQLAKDNMIFVSALFRKTDALAVDGFSEDMQLGREDWEFWIKLLKNGGEVVQLPLVGFYYRLTPNSKRKKTGGTDFKKARIAYLNTKHADFFERELNGPLRIQRSWSKPYNTLLKLFGKL
ncbi:MAG: glycosyltransferase family A protein [Bacteroidetes bacterium]|nr:glycosyltransferase family A protein [Bacteroidota bacterium]MDA1268353.1 glycosyltransferase family A protein [Bacteroidota bacterium]